MSKATRCYRKNEDRLSCLQQKGFPIERIVLAFAF